MPQEFLHQLHLATAMFMEATEWDGLWSRVVLIVFLSTHPTVLGKKRPSLPPSLAPHLPAHLPIPSGQGQSFPCSSQAPPCFWTHIDRVNRQANGAHKPMTSSSSSQKTRPDAAKASRKWKNDCFMLFLRLCIRAKLP